MPLVKLEIKFLSKKRLSSKFWLFEFEAERFEFEAGQYLSMKVAENGMRRSYSIASASRERPLQLLVDVSPMGVGSKFLLGLKENQKVEVLGAMGEFTAKKAEEKRNEVLDLVFVGTGSGVAPLRSIIRDLLINKKETKKISLYWGLRFEKDVFLLDELDDLKKNYVNFDYDLVLSKPTQKWLRCSGHVTDCLLKHGLDFKKTLFYLCGNRKMVEDVSGFLVEKKVVRERIFFEKFW